MFPTRILLQQQRQPLIRFLGKRTPPKKVDHTPHAHPASPTHSLPDSFASYRSKASQHGPLNGGSAHGRSGASLGSVKPAQGEAFDRTELPRRFKKIPWTLEEIEAIDSAGASLYQ